MNVVKTWPQFARQVRAKTPLLLNSLDNFENAILITGCQRSGGTMLNRVIMDSYGVANFKRSKDEELDAALILSGVLKPPVKGRYCFQTTYLNECYREYLDHTNNKIIWSLRNPFSVCYSMVYNWKAFALNEVFLSCGYSFMDCADRVRFQRFGIFGIPKIRRAAYAFKGKVNQLLELEKLLPNERLIILDYDDLVHSKAKLLPALYERVDLPYQSTYGDMISNRSVDKQSGLKDSERAQIQCICGEVYSSARDLINLID